MKDIPVRMRATYDCVYWPDPEDDDPAQWGGWCDPHNPWGSLWGDDEYDPDDDSDAYGRGEPIEIVLPLNEAVEFVCDFPGAVWDLWEGESSVNYRTGVDVSVTLHVEDHEALVLGLAERRQKRIDAALRRRTA
jgi:hypothetical protein